MDHSALVKVLCLVSLMGLPACLPQATQLQAAQPRAVIENEEDRGSIPGKTGYLSPLEQEIVNEINMARKNPAGYATFLEQTRRFYVGRQFKQPGQITIITQEGVNAVDEAIRFLRSTAPLCTVTPSRGMSLGAKDHCRDLGATGRFGHTGSDGSRMSDRVNRYGSWDKVVSECIYYGANQGRDIVMGLIVDDGVSDRGHRKNLFHPDVHVVGVTCGYHPTYKNMCVIDLAGGYSEKTGK